MEEEGRPLLLIAYAPGAVKTRGRELLAYVRLAWPEGPPPLVVQTNGRDFALWETASGKEIAAGGPEVVPPWEALRVRPPAPPLSPKRKKIEEKILFIYLSGG